VAGVYRVELRPRAEKDLAALPRDSQRRIARAIDALAEDPRPAGCVTLRGGEGLLRIRVGVYRVVYLVEDDRLVVLVVRIGHRRDVYRQR
jgi:mRNA interferase RelE/StbE